MSHSKPPRPKVDIAAMIDSITPETLHSSPWDDNDFDHSLVDQWYAEANEAANKKRGYALTEDEIQRNFIRAAEESDRHFKETGLHVTSEELHEWLEALKTNPDAPIPECHT